MNKQSDNLSSFVLEYCEKCTVLAPYCVCGSAKEETEGENIPKIPPATALKPNRAGIVCFNRAGEVLLISALGNPNVWLFPKGHIESWETSMEAAERECREEANVESMVDTAEPLCYTSYVYNNEEIVVEWWCGLGIRSVTSTGYDEIDWRRVRWLPPEKAFDMLSFQSLKDVLRQALCYPDVDIAA